MQRPCSELLRILSLVQVEGRGSQCSRRPRPTTGALKLQARAGFMLEPGAGFLWAGPELHSPEDEEEAGRPPPDLLRRLQGPEKGRVSSARLGSAGRGPCCVSRNQREESLEGSGECRQTQHEAADDAVQRCPLATAATAAAAATTAAAQLDHSENKKAERAERCLHSEPLPDHLSLTELRFFICTEEQQQRGRNKLMLGNDDPVDPDPDPDPELDPHGGDSTLKLKDDFADSSVQCLNKVQVSLLFLQLHFCRINLDFKVSEATDGGSIWNIRGRFSRDEVNVMLRESCPAFSEELVFLSRFLSALSGQEGGLKEANLQSGPPPPLHLLVVPSLQPPAASCSCRVAAPLLLLLRGGSGFIHEEQGRGGRGRKMAAVCLRVPTTPCQLSIVIPSAACLP
ncbi:uncharacterized protein V6R79_019883 [Siganus canaliculatus]